MYTVNQYGDFSPSDGYDGDASDPTGWADYTDPLILWENDEGEPLTGAGSADTLDDNDPGDTNADGDYTDILKVGLARQRARVARRDRPLPRHGRQRRAGDVLHGGAGRRRGRGRVEQQPRDGHAHRRRGWRQIGMARRGLWKVWGECDGETPSFVGDTPYFAINEDGKHLVKLLSTDMVGNTEGPANDFTVGVDLTPRRSRSPTCGPTT